VARKAHASGALQQLILTRGGFGQVRNVPVTVPTVTINTKIVPGKSDGRANWLTKRRGYRSLMYQ
jgi:hypothetical protein